MRDIYKKVKDQFSAELATDGDVWRILRKETLVDLIKLHFFSFQKDKDNRRLVDLFNYSMKVKLLSRIHAIDVNGSLDEITNKFNHNPEFILKQYDILYNELEPAFKNYSSATLFDLNKKIQYIKVINELEIDAYTDVVFNEIIGITYNMLSNE